MEVSHDGVVAILPDEPYQAALHCFNSNRNRLAYLP
jgi:hypothetical protein